MDIGCSKCHQSTNLICSRCHIARYCSKDCQQDAWRSGHKEVCKPGIKITDLAENIFQILVSDGQRRGILACEYKGQKVIDGDCIWFLKELHHHIEGNVMQHYMTAENPMTMDEFLLYYTVGKGYVWSHGIGFALYMMMQKKNLCVDNRLVKKVLFSYEYLTAVRCGYLIPGSIPIMYQTYFATMIQFQKQTDQPGIMRCCRH